LVLEPVLVEELVVVEATVLVEVVVVALDEVPVVRGVVVVVDDPHAVVKTAMAQSSGSMTMR
jgi:hypothetical protein